MEPYDPVSIHPNPGEPAHPAVPYGEARLVQRTHNPEPQPLVAEIVDVQGSRRERIVEPFRIIWIATGMALATAGMIGLERIWPTVGGEGPVPRRSELSFISARRIYLREAEYLLRIKRFRSLSVVASLLAESQLVETHQSFHVARHKIETIDRQSRQVSVKVAGGEEWLWPSTRGFGRLGV